MKRLVSILMFFGYIKLLDYVGVGGWNRVYCLVAVLSMMGYAYYEGLTNE